MSKSILLTWQNVMHKLFLGETNNKKIFASVRVLYQWKLNIFSHEWDVAIKIFSLNN